LGVKLLNWFFDKFKKKSISPEATQLETLRDGLKRPPEDHDIAKLYPQIMPLSLLRPDWPGPIEQLGDLPFCVSWAIAEPQNYFRYVSWEMSRYWEDVGINWKAKAMNNLAELSRSYPFSGTISGADEKPYILCLINNDSMGPSRLLVPGLFADMFGDDYTVAIPERTCAVVYRNGLQGEEAIKANSLIDECFEVGTEPMSNERFNPKRFWTF